MPCASGSGLRPMKGDVQELMLSYDSYWLSIEVLTSSCLMQLSSEQNIDMWGMSRRILAR